MVAIWGLQQASAAFGRARHAASARPALELDTPRRTRAWRRILLKGDDRDRPNAEREFQRALAFEPDYSTAHQVARAAARESRTVPGSRDAYRARAEHQSPLSRNRRSPCLISIWLPATTRERCTRRRLQSTWRTLLDAGRLLGIRPRANLFSGGAQAAVSVLERGAELAGPFSMWEAALGFARARAGNGAGVLAILSGLHERAECQVVSPLRSLHLFPRA